MTNRDEIALPPVEPATIKALIEQSITKYSELPALSYYDNEPTTYSDLAIKIREMTRLLKENEIRKGDRVSILGENSPNWGIAYLSIVSMGAVVVPILPDFPAPDVETILNHSESKILFTTKKQFDKLNYDRCKLITKVILLDDFSIEETRFETITFSEFIKDAYKKISAIIHDIGEKTGLVSGDLNPDDLAAIIYTSGTTGMSKGVMLTHGNIVSNVNSMRALIRFDTNDRFLSLLPLSHSLECTVGFLYPLSCGVSIYYVGTTPNPTVIKKASSIAKPTAIPMVPLIIEKIYKKRVKVAFEKNIVTRGITNTPIIRKLLYKKAAKAIKNFFGGELRLLAIGGAPLNEEVENFLIKSGFPYLVGYGLTETSPLVTGERIGETRPGSCGYPVKDVEVKIVDPEPGSKVGEIYVRGPNVMKGYFKNSKITKDSFTDDGWFITGDRGYLDSDNFLYIKGRSKNMFLGPSGENIYPEVIEEKLNENLIVEESLVIENKGEIEALIFLDHEMLKDRLSGKSETESENIIREILGKIKDDSNQQLPKFSAIRRCHFQSEPFAKTATKKIKRYLYYHPSGK